MTSIADNLQAVRRRIERAAAQCGRAPDEIRLVAVSKTFRAAAIEEAYRRGGQCAFGESYVQEAVEKVTALAHCSLEWHFIGPLQSNKTRWVAEHFHWFHAVDRERIAARLSAARPAHLPPINVCIQVNVSDEPTKSGVAPGEEARLARSIADLPGLRLRGLMAIPEPTSDVAVQRSRYARVRELKESLVAAGHEVDTLSMGMSDDLESAIAEGATIVRVGTAIFGERETL